MSITLSPNLKQYSRKDAAELLRERIHQADDDNSETVTLSRGEAERLYKQYLPKLPARAKTAEQWAAKAVTGARDCRYYLQYLYSDGENLIATDGHRLHRVKTTSYAPGFYCPKSFNPVDVDVKYPDCERFFQGEPVLRKYHLSNARRCVISYRGKDFQVIKLPSENGDVGLNAQYINDATNNNSTADLYIASPKEPVYGVSEFGEFVVMPMRI